MLASKVHSLVGLWCNGLLGSKWSLVRISHDLLSLAFATFHYRVCHTVRKGLKDKGKKYQVRRKFFTAGSAFINKICLNLPRLK